MTSIYNDRGREEWRKRERKGGEPHPLFTFLAMYPLGPSFAIFICPT